MPKVDVFRVETAEGLGPYRNAVTECPGKNASYLTGDWEAHPLPTEDGIDRYELTPYHLFGFESLDALRAWFFRKRRDAELMAAKGLLVVSYRLSERHVLKGMRQLAFRRDFATKINVQEIQEVAA